MGLLGRVMQPHASHKDNSVNKPQPTASIGHSLTIRYLAGLLKGQLLFDVNEVVTAVLTAGIGPGWVPQEPQCIAKVVIGRRVGR